MSALNMPYGAAEILALRKSGKRPAEMVLVSLVGPLPGEGNPQVLAKPERSYDWRFLLGLNVLIVASSDTSKAEVRRIIGELQPLPVEYLGVWLTDRQKGFHVAHGTVKHRTRLTQFLDQSELRGLVGLGFAQEGGARCA